MRTADESDTNTQPGDDDQHFMPFKWIKEILDQDAKSKKQAYNVLSDCLSAGLYPEIPEGSELDFSALKEEVPLH